MYTHLLTLLFLTIVRKIFRKNAESGQHFTLHSKEKAKVKNEKNEAENHVWPEKKACYSAEAGPPDTNRRKAHE